MEINQKLINRGEKSTTFSDPREASQWHESEGGGSFSSTDLTRAWRSAMAHSELEQSVGLSRSRTWRKSNPGGQCAQPAALQHPPCADEHSPFLQSSRIFVMVPGVTCHWFSQTLGVTVAASWQKGMHWKPLPRQPQKHNSGLILFTGEEGVSSPGRLVPSSCFWMSVQYLVDSQGSYLKLSLGNSNQERRCLALCETRITSGCWAHSNPSCYPDQGLKITV